VGLKSIFEIQHYQKNETKCNDFKHWKNYLFYIESPAMRGLLRRLKCDNYKILVAASSIIRPGVAQSGMMKEYFRHNHPDQFEYFHETFKEHLRNLWCYGVSGRCNKIALHFAGVPASWRCFAPRDEW
jgi:DNA polymerase-3 subunit alpha/error-prone DNA polymerase